MVHREGYLHHVHYFRGFAILNIVAIHAAAIAHFVPSGGSFDTTPLFSAITEALFHDATLYFALISGLLFSVVLKPRGLKTFFRSKLKNVILPYLFCTLAFSWVVLNMDGNGVISLRESFTDWLGAVPSNLILGEAQFTYWYIPILLALFAATPLVAALTGRSGFPHLLIWVLMLLPLVVSRAEFVDGDSRVRPATFVYFLGAYTAGLHLGDRLEERLEHLSKYWAALVATVFLTTIALVALEFKEAERWGFYSIQESLYYVQKICAAVLVLIAFQRVEPGRLEWLSPIADAAFSIYFLHAFFMMLIAELTFTFLVDERFLPGSIYLMTSVYFVSALALSMLCVFVFRRAFGQRSRMLIGS